MPYEYEAIMGTKGKVIDGDSIRVGSLDLGFGIFLNNQSLRLHGIDTPESWGTRKKNPEEYKFGMLAKQYLLDHITPSFVIRSKAFNKGKYGRILCEVILYVPEFDREMSIGQAMILKNLAVPYHGQSKKEIEEQHLKNREILYESGMVIKG